MKKSKWISRCVGILWGILNLFLFAFILKAIFDSNSKHVLDLVVFVTLFVVFGSAIIGGIEFLCVNLPATKMIKKMLCKNKKLSWEEEDELEESIKSSMVIWATISFVVFGHFVFKAIVGTNLILNIIMLFCIGCFVFGMEYMAMGSDHDKKTKRITATTIQYGSHLSTTEYKDQDGNRTTVEHWKF